jgi:cell shape-determining protein MreC
MESLRVKGTAYEEGIDDKTKVNRLLEEIEHLENRIGQYAEENHELREQLGLNSF